MGLSTFLRQRTASRVAAVALASLLSAGCMCATAFADDDLADVEGAVGEAPVLAEPEAYVESAASAASESRASWLSVAKPTQQQIRNYIINNNIDVTQLATFTSQPSIKQPYAAGALTQSSLNNALNMLNLCRYIAGIPANVTLNSEYNQKAQAASIVMAANRGLNHYPDRPAGMSDELYNLACGGANASNLSFGVYGPAESLLLYMDDSDASNIDRLGHRWWCLSPRMQQTGFGYANGYSAMYAFDNAQAVNEYEDIAWPAANMPASLFSSSQAWSFSGPWIDGQDASTSIKLVRARDGKTWNFSNATADGYFGIHEGSNGLYDRQTVIFRPDNVGAYKAGDHFTVTVKNATRTFTYTVDFFDIFQVDSVKLAMHGEGNSLKSAGTTLNLKVGDTVALVAQPSVSQAGSKTLQFFGEAAMDSFLASWSTSSSSVAGVTMASSSNGTYFSYDGVRVPGTCVAYIDARKAGTSTITVSGPNGVQAKITVNVGGETGKWRNDSRGYWFQLSGGGYPKSQWAQIDGKWYRFNGSGYMQTGWQKIGGSWYYLGGKSDGSMKTGWHKISGTWYYFKDSGAMATGWTKVGNTWYYMNGSGAMQTGWLKSGKTWYYLKGSGAMATGWQKVGGSWYYLKSSGAMATGWYKDGGSWYYSNGSGVMQKSKWVGNYYLQGSGAMATNKWIGQYYVGADGAWVRNA